MSDAVTNALLSFVSQTPSATTASATSIFDSLTKGARDRLSPAPGAPPHGPNSLETATSTQQHNEFMRRLRFSQSSDLVHSIKQFVLGLSLPASFSSGAEEDGAADRRRAAEEEEEDRPAGSDEPYRISVRSFYAQTEQRMATHSSFSDLHKSANLWTEVVQEGLERFLMHKIHPRVFAPTARHVESDAQLSTKVQRLRGWLRPQHLDLKPGLADVLVTDAWLSAGEELRKMDGYRAPRDKVTSALNACRVVVDLLKSSSASSAKSKDEGFAADDLISGLVYLIVRSNPPRLYSNIQYVCAYRSEALFRGEAAFLVLQLEAATTFVMRSSHASFKLSEHVYDALCEDSLTGVQALTESSSTLDAVGETSFAAAAASATPSAGGDAAAAPWQGPNGQAWLEKRFRFESAEASSMMVSQIPALLEEYRTLVRVVRSLVSEGEHEAGGAPPPT